MCSVQKVWVLGEETHTCENVDFILKYLEERFEIAFAEALAAHATDDLEEHLGAILQRLGEELSNCVLG